MQVKCPKCRLRFESLAAAGVTELQCNCPRCGTPFTYLAEETDGEPAPAPQAAAEASATAEVSAAAAESSSSQSEPQSESQSSPQSESFRESPRKSEPSSVASSKPSPMPLPQPDLPLEPLFKPRRHRYSELMEQGNLKRTALTVIGIVAALIVALLAVTKGVDSVMTSMDDGAYMPSGIIEEPDTTASDTAKATTKANTKKAVAHATKKDKLVKQEKPARAEEHDEAVPAWLQGRWEVNGGETDLTFRITANAITVSDAFHTSHGSASYRNGRLVCRLRNGHTFVYTTDRHRRRIIAGDGTVMTPM